MGKHKSFDVRLTRHAVQRLRERLPRAKVASICGRLRHRIRTELRTGIQVDSWGCFEIEIRPDIWAICAPSFMGGYEVITIYVAEDEDEPETEVQLELHKQPARG